LPPSTALPFKYRWVFHSCKLTRLFIGVGNFFVDCGESTKMGTGEAYGARRLQQVSKNAVKRKAGFAKDKKSF
jgi:hypothetical protein